MQFAGGIRNANGFETIPIFASLDIITRSFMSVLQFQGKQNYPSVKKKAI